MSPKSGYSVFGKDDDDIDDNGDGDDDGDDGELPGCGKDHVFLVSALFSIVSTVQSRRVGG